MRFGFIASLKDLFVDLQDLIKQLVLALLRLD
jgi:hypothetical protein